MMKISNNSEVKDNKASPIFHLQSPSTICSEGHGNVAGLYHWRTCFPSFMTQRCSGTTKQTAFSSSCFKDTSKLNADDSLYCIVVNLLKMMFWWSQKKSLVLTFHLHSLNKCRGGQHHAGQTPSSKLLMLSWRWKWNFYRLSAVHSSHWEPSMSHDQWADNSGPRPLSMGSSMRSWRIVRIIYSRDGISSRELNLE